MGKIGFAVLPMVKPKTCFSLSSDFSYTNEGANFASGATIWPNLTSAQFISSKITPP